MYANQRPLVAIRACPCTGADESTFGWESEVWHGRQRLDWDLGGGGYWGGMNQSSSRVTDQESGIIWAAVNGVFFFLQYGCCCLFDMRL